MLDIALVVYLTIAVICTVALVLEEHDGLAFAMLIGALWPLFVLLMLIEAVRGR